MSFWHRLVTCLLPCWCIACLAQAPAADRADPGSFDQQVRALRAAGEPVEPDDLIIWEPLPDDRNSAKVVHGLVKRMRQGTPEGGLWHQRLSKQLLSDYVLPLSAADQAELREALAPQADVLATLDRIRELDGFDWGRTLPSPLVIHRPDNPFPFGAFWGAARKQLLLDGLLAVSEGDTARAWKRVETLRRLAEGMSIYPGDEDLGPLWFFLHESAAKLACSAATNDGRNGDNIDREMLESLIGYWIDDRHALDAYVRYLRKERVAIIDSLYNVKAGTLQPEQMRLGGYEVSNYHEMRMNIPAWQTATALHTCAIDALKAASALSRGDSGRRLDMALRDLPSGEYDQMLVLSAISPKFASHHDFLLRLRSRQKLAACAVAIRLYRLEHEDRFPASLDELVPQYLPAVPSDPTSKEPAPVRYRANGDRSILWVAGQNGIDDGGTPRPPDVREFENKPVDEVVPLVLPAGE